MTLALARVRKRRLEPLADGGTAPEAVRQVVEAAHAAHPAAARRAACGAGRGDGHGRRGRDVVVVLDGHLDRLGRHLLALGLGHRRRGLVDQLVDAVARLGEEHERALAREAVADTKKNKKKKQKNVTINFNNYSLKTTHAHR